MHEVSRRFLDLFQTFFPSWRFFDRVGSQFTLQYRLVSQFDQRGHIWRPVFSYLPIKWHALVMNAEPNAQLAFYTLVERAAFEIADLADGADFEKTVTYEQLVRLVRTSIAATQGDFQFQIVDETGEAILLSTEHPC